MRTTQCPKCIHLIGSGRNGPVCVAFPKGIPLQIVTGKFDHVKKFEGDKGVRFEDRNETFAIKLREQKNGYKTNAD